MPATLKPTYEELVAMLVLFVDSGAHEKNCSLRAHHEHGASIRIGARNRKPRETQAECNEANRRDRAKFAAAAPACDCVVAAARALLGKVPA